MMPPGYAPALGATHAPTPHPQFPPGMFAPDFNGAAYLHSYAHLAASPYPGDLSGSHMHPDLTNAWLYPSSAHPGAAGGHPAGQHLAAAIAFPGGQVAGVLPASSEGATATSGTATSHPSHPAFQHPYGVGSVGSMYASPSPLSSGQHGTQGYSHPHAMAHLGMPQIHGYAHMPMPATPAALTPAPVHSGNEGSEDDGEDGDEQ